MKVCPHCKGRGRISGPVPRACTCVLGRSQARAGDSRGAKTTTLFQLSEVVEAWRAGRTAAAQVARIMARARAAGATPADVQTVGKFTEPELQSILASVPAQGQLW